MTPVHAAAGRSLKSAMGNNCLICSRINEIKEGRNPFFVRELKTGYVVIGDHQFYSGYTLFICKLHVLELHQLEPLYKTEFLNEMSLVAESVYRAFKPKKLNYELLGNTKSHMHWHIFPRYEDDPNPAMPIWLIDKSIRCADNTKPTDDELGKLKSKLSKQLDDLVPLYD